MTYEELLINIELNGYDNVLLAVGKICLVGKKYLDYSHGHWFVICDDGDCHLFDENGIEDDISKVKEIHEYMIPKDIKKIAIPDGVTSIKEYAFEHCNWLTSITIPNSVINIGYEAFRNCSKLTSVIIGNNAMNIGVGAFYECSRLTNVTIGNSVTNIGWSAFENCSELKSITIPNSITRIGWRAFWNCYKLKSITIDKSIGQVKEMDNYPFGIEDESIIKCN